MALRVVATKSRLYRTGTLRRAAKVRVLSTDISLPCALRKDFVHLSLRGLRSEVAEWLEKDFKPVVTQGNIWDSNVLILKFLWHFERQKRKTLASFRTNWIPLEG